MANNFVAATLVAAASLHLVAATCTDVADSANDCSGHGTCSGEPTQVCTCYGGAYALCYRDVGVGRCPLPRPACPRPRSLLLPHHPLSPSETSTGSLPSSSRSSTTTTDYFGGDCSKRLCPKGKAWFGVPSTANVAHLEAECSNAGDCDYASGQCACVKPYTGEACQYLGCLNDCSGHGRCMTLKQMAQEPNAMPIAYDTTYDAYEDTTTWDQNMIMGCVCDSAWVVGLGAGETQVGEYFGSDCSMRHCPSADDPKTSIDETDCGSNQPPGINGTNNATAGNLCHVECSNNGICDFEKGQCLCFHGFYGESCSLNSVLANDMTM